ncbi:N-acetylglucosamine 6-phosphate deacetylase [Octadecabacter temperatus]|uniref:N-acetylglucosamine-6-phosphate deacetylase n=1 Tax=Octadecabacter temperatus TaxID=1458307 RepID=A0A0K0Y6P0_9RHOB|nr:N-acetylglucosamine-6-phosphate deacetylase [Octadecabacter temperatus]AKS46634.1 N-acetylglucosamine-6-phosphate deacetylase [Octadecabacter temperatus]SIO18223.1 N-acetylglucosamine 6-phosphate deacetylase [Octadecabacter temperatus]
MPTLLTPSTVTKAYIGAAIHDGETLHADHALALLKHGVFDVVPVAALPNDCPLEKLDGGIITPAFVDLQVNGGGGVMFNDDQSVDTLRTIAAAHAQTGTGAILPTLITDTPARTSAAIDAVEHAIQQGVPGIAGIHLEGPHLCVARKGAHDPALIRPMTDDDLSVLLDAATRISNIIVTVAPENVTLTQIKAMSQAGIVVSLGHTDADTNTCHAAFDAGARCVTHLFNAMSQLGSREPGLVGATLARPEIFAGLIADGIHVHPETISIALTSKPERMFLVTDAMSTVDSKIASFTLNGREIFRSENRLTLADGTLAGADLNMPKALSVMVNDAKDAIERTVMRATSTPAQLLRDAGSLGRLGTGAKMAVYLAKDATSASVLRVQT